MDVFDEQKAHFIENFKCIDERINEALVRANRKRSEVKLLAATKTVPVEVINFALENGITLMGENRVQELCEKLPGLKAQTNQIHLIGHLQTNKVAQVVGKVCMIQSVDSAHLAAEISRRSLQKGIVTDILVEVNMENELSKSGVAPEKAAELLSEISAFEGIKVKGLMAIPPIMENNVKSRQIFSNIYKLFIDICDQKIDNIEMTQLSMGMSDDFENAIEEGSSMIRVGSALFGKRNYNK